MNNSTDAKGNREILTIREIIDFRKANNLGKMNPEIIRRFWRNAIKLDQIGNLPRNRVQELKVEMAKDMLSRLPKYFIKFIGISGSVANGEVKDVDDIDLFIVTKNNSLWIFRFIFMLAGKRRGYINSSKALSAQDKLCVNLITEEGNLIFENSVGNLHELIHLIPIYNSRFLCKIYESNSWMKKDYEANYSEYISTLDDDKFCLDKKKSLFTKILAKTFLPIINFFLFLSQGFLMAVHGVKVSLLIKWLREKRFAIFEAKK